MTSQSANAHLELFKLIFSIAESDTGLPVRFRHIHGDGYETFVADSHKGQALGIKPNSQVQKLPLIIPRSWFILPIIMQKHESKL